MEGTISSKVLTHIKNDAQDEKPCIPHNSFKRVITEMSEGYRWNSEALEALQYATEGYMAGLLNQSGMCMDHAGRKTLRAKDLNLARRIRGIE